uniref:Lrr n=1 Tax=Rosa rugosa TaxID=74645 RepID=J7FWQ7_ROSRU|nr:lrr [Rosa rugosa]
MPGNYLNPPNSTIHNRTVEAVIVLPAPETSPNFQMQERFHEKQNRALTSAPPLATWRRGIEVTNGVVAEHVVAVGGFGHAIDDGGHLLLVDAVVGADHRSRNPRSVVRWESPHPLIPLIASLKHLSYLRTLKLNDCNLCEGEIPNDIGSLSSLWMLELRGNNFVSLPASIHLLSKLRVIDVENCKRLQHLPELPVNDSLHVKTNNCTSLQVFPDPPDLYRLSTFLLSCVNCLSKETHRSFYYFRFVIPGSEIPGWFNNQSVGDSVMRSYLRMHVINGFRAKQNIVSDHFLLVVLPNHFRRPEDCLDEDTCNEVNFVFRSSGTAGNNRCLQIKKCGARVLYEHDTEELISKMNQYPRAAFLFTRLCMNKKVPWLRQQQAEVVALTTNITLQKNEGILEELHGLALCLV